MIRLYDAVAAGMWAYSHAAFRLSVLGPPRIELAPGTLIVATHRRETDVPVIAPPLYYRARLWRRSATPMSFAARDDMFLPGFFAGFAPDVPPPVRKLLYPVGVGRWLPLVEVHPIRSASVARLGEVLEGHRDVGLDDVVRDEIAAQLVARADAAQLPPPRAAGDALRGEYADLLWRPVEPGDTADRAGDFWRRRTGQAAADFRELVDLVREGGVLVVFPEGRPSSTGEIGPLRPGIGALVRRARPRRIQPVALAYDPLVSGRTRVFVSLPKPVEPPRENVEDELLALMRRSMPLTAGQVVASRLVERDRADLGGVATALDSAIEEARVAGRPVEPALLGAETRRGRLAEAVAAAVARPRTLAYLARELADARAVS